VLRDETHVEVDEIWHKRKFVVYFTGRKLILNYHVGDRDYISPLEYLARDLSIETSD